MSRVTVKPEILRWARERADRSVESLRGRFPRYELWERGEAAPTYRTLIQQSAYEQRLAGVISLGTVSLSFDGSAPAQPAD